jgi:hypothetical protein
MFSFGHNGKSSGCYLEFVKILVFQCIRSNDVIFCPDDENFLSEPSSMQEASNYSSLHPSGCLNSMSRRHSVFHQLWDFFPKHKYGKIAVTFRKMCTPVRTCSFIWKVVHSKFNHPDDSIHGPEAQASYMGITCIRSTIRTTDVMVRRHQALI